MPLYYHEDRIEANLIGEQLKLIDIIMKKLFILALASSLCMVSCSDDVSDGGAANSAGGQNSQSNAVTFTQTISSRVDGNQFQNSDGITIFYNVGATLSSPTGVDYTYNGSDFNVSTGQTGINVEAEVPQSYVAVYPAKDDTSFTHTIATDQSSGYSASDLLVATALDTDNPSVELEFYHKMSKLQVTIELHDERVEDAAASLAVTSPIFTLQNKASCDIVAGTYSATAEADASITPYVTTSKVEVDKVSTTVYSAIIAPQTKSDDTIATITVQNGDNIVQTLKWSDSATFESDKFYTYKWIIQVSDFEEITDKIMYDGVISNWDDSSNGVTADSSISGTDE